MGNSTVVVSTLQQQSEFWTQGVEDDEAWGASIQAIYSKVSHQDWFFWVSDSTGVGNKTLTLVIFYFQSMSSGFCFKLGPASSDNHFARFVFIRSTSSYQVPTSLLVMRLSLPVLPVAQKQFFHASYANVSLCLLYTPTAGSRKPPLLCSNQRFTNQQ